jgi:hypothetical protein
VVLATVHELTYLAGGPTHVLFLGLFLGAVAAATAGVLALLWEPATFLLPVGRGLGMLWILAISLVLLVGRAGETMAAAEERRGGAPRGPRRQAPGGVARPWAAARPPEDVRRGEVYTFSRTRPEVPRWIKWNRSTSHSRAAENETNRS